VANPDVEVRSSRTV